jgi:hypothetical protein
MKKTIIAVAVCGTLQGCAATPYQYQSDPELSTPANIIEDQSSLMPLDVGDGNNGSAPKYHRGSLGTLFNIGLAATGAVKPIPGISPALSAVAYYNAGVDSDTPIHKQPLVFGYWPYSDGDNDHTGGARFMGYVDEAVNAMANEANGSAQLITNDMLGDVKVNAWKVVADGLGCTEDRACVLSVNIVGTSFNGYQPADWFLEHADYTSMVAEVDSPVVAEGATHATAWGTVNNGGKNRSQFMFLQDDMKKQGGMDELYSAISKHLPSGIFLYVPPEKNFGIDSESPYMVHEGEAVKFQSP